MDTEDATMVAESDDPDSDEAEMDNIDGWVDKVERMTEAKNHELKESIHPIKLAVGKVGTRYLT